MSDRLNKPRVFLSHSKADAALIEQPYDDLRKCQIEPWLDKVEIRHGRPWLDAIFEDGIPTCDCVLVYLTENSLNSAMVKKELDAAVLGQLRDRNVALLPYVDDEARRSGLRADIRALQVPVLNGGNYVQLLPRIVAEIWRSFLERTVPAAVQRERVKRLEAELEIEKLRNASGEGVFTESEEREFDYIFSRLDRREVIEFQVQAKVDGEVKTLQTVTFSLSVISLLPTISDSQHYEYSDSSLVHGLRRALEPEIPGYDREEKKVSVAVTRHPELANELLMYGFVQRVHHDRTKNESGILGIMSYGPSHHFVYTDRLERFKYWLAFKGVLPNEMVWSMGSSEEENGSAERAGARDG